MIIGVRAGTEDSLLALDPGVTAPGVAIFRRGRLIAATRIKIPKTWAALDRADRARRVAGAVHEWAYASGVDEVAMVEAWRLVAAGDVAGATALRAARGVQALVSEYPFVYPRGKALGRRRRGRDPDPNTAVLPMACVVGALAGRLDIPVVTYLPAEWTGGTHKDTTGDPRESARGELIWAALDVDERAVLAAAATHDAFDAAGVGLHHLRRLHHHVYPGST